MLPFVKCVSQKDLQLQVDAKVIFIDYCALVLAVALPFLLRFRQEWRYAVPTEVSSVKFCRHWRRYSLPTELKLCPSQWSSAIGVAWWGKDTFQRRPYFKRWKDNNYIVCFLDLHKGECSGCNCRSFIDYNSCKKIEVVSGLGWP